MTSTNGTNSNHAQPSGPIVREILLDSGVVVRSTTLSPHAFAKIRQRAEALFPNPNEEDFRKPIPNAAIEGDTYIDKDDPEYLRLTEAAVKGRTEFITRALRETTLDFPDGKEALIERFASKVAALREFIDLPEDEWEATFWHCIIGSAADHETLIWAAENALPLTGEEIADGLRLFRYSVQGERPGNMAAGRRALARSLQKIKEDKG